MLLVMMSVCQQCLRVVDDDVGVSTVLRVADDDDSWCESRV